jgi:hypothetical protein
MIEYAAEREVEFLSPPVALLRVPLPQGQF